MFALGKEYANDYLQFYFCLQTSHPKEPVVDEIAPSVEDSCQARRDLRSRDGGCGPTNRIDAPDAPSLKNHPLLCQFFF